MNVYRPIWWITLFAWTVVIAGCGNKDAGPLAVVGKTKITVSDFELALANLPENYKVLKESYKGKRTILTNLVKKHLLIFEAERRGYQKDAAIKKKIKEVQTQARERLEQQMQRLQQRLRHIDRQVYENVLLSELDLHLKREGLKDVTISPEEIETYYQDYARKVKILNPAANVPKLATVKQQIEAILVEEKLLKKLEKEFSVEIKEEQFRQRYGGQEEDITIK